MGSIESVEPEPKKSPRGIVSQSSSIEPAQDAGKTQVVPEAEPPQAGETVPASEVTAVSADAQQAISTRRARQLKERRVEDRRQSKRRTTDAQAVPPPPPIEVPTPLTVERTPVDLAASAAMAKDILAANEDQPPPPPTRRDARPTTPADGSAASPPDASCTGRSGGRAAEEPESAAVDDAPVGTSFFASTRGKKRFRRE